MSAKTFLNPAWVTALAFAAAWPSSDELKRALAWFEIKATISRITSAWCENRV
jgi:hypothetical protein